MVAWPARAGEHDRRGRERAAGESRGARGWRSADPSRTSTRNGRDGVSSTGTGPPSHGADRGARVQTRDSTLRSRLGHAPRRCRRAEGGSEGEVVAVVGGASWPTATGTADSTARRCRGSRSRRTARSLESRRMVDVERRAGSGRAPDARTRSARRNPRRPTRARARAPLESGATSSGSTSTLPMACSASRPGWSPARSAGRCTVATSVSVCAPAVEDVHAVVRVVPERRWCRAARARPAYSPARQVRRKRTGPLSP